MAGRPEPIRFLREGISCLSSRQESRPRCNTSSRWSRHGGSLHSAKRGPAGSAFLFGSTPATTVGGLRTILILGSVIDQALRCSVSESGGQGSSFRRGLDETARKPADTSGFNVDWGPGRGFRTGDTLPDIPLIDLQGNEVRFSRFLGKRYILYCWASW